jgi:hypothetical protein
VSTDAAHLLQALESEELEERAHWKSICALSENYIKSEGYGFPPWILILFFGWENQKWRKTETTFYTQYIVTVILAAFAMIKKKRQYLRIGTLGVITQLCFLYRLAAYLHVHLFED